MSDVVVESMASGDTMHVAHSSAQMGCFLVFAVVCALSAMAETAHARLHGRNGSGKREDDLGDLPLTATGASRGPGDSSLGISKRDEESGERAAASSTDESVGSPRRSWRAWALGRAAARAARARAHRAGRQERAVASRGTRARGRSSSWCWRSSTSPTAPVRSQTRKVVRPRLVSGAVRRAAAYGWRTSLHKSKTHALESGTDGGVEGLMQVLFLLYHY